MAGVVAVHPVPLNEQYGRGPGRHPLVISVARAVGGVGGVDGAAVAVLQAHPCVARHVGSLPLNPEHVAATGALQPPAKRHAADAEAPAAVEQSAALPLPVPHVAGGLQPPVNVQALVAEAPAAVEHAAALALPDPQVVGSVQPVPLKVQ